jgi:CcmD family protein
MENLGYLIAAYAIIGAVVFGYIVFLYYKQRKLRRQMDSLIDSIVEKQEHSVSEERNDNPRE